MTLAEQLACVEREIERREGEYSEYPDWSERKRKGHDVDHDIDVLRAVAETLRGLMEKDENGS